MYRGLLTVDAWMVTYMLKYAIIMAALGRTIMPAPVKVSYTREEECELERQKEIERRHI